MTDRYATEMEVHQVEAEADDAREFPVRVEGPVDVRTLPSVSWTITRHSPTDASGPVKAVSRNPYRRVLRLSTAGALTFLYGASNEQVRTRATAGIGSAASSPVEMTHTEEVWINNVAGETPEVTVVEEMWAS